MYKMQLQNSYKNVLNDQISHSKMTKDMEMAEKRAIAMEIQARQEKQRQREKEQLVSKVQQQ